MEKPWILTLTSTRAATVTDECCEKGHSSIWTHVDISVRFSLQIKPHRYDS